jgi:tetratricopeptide (TPR) repeat protein
MGGGHMGGGHMGGSHMGGGGLTGSHMGGFNAHSGFSGGSHIGGQHMGGVQHLGGMQHQGLQHQGIQHQGIQHQGLQHQGVGGLQHQSVLNGVTHPQGNNAFHGGQQHLGNAATTHHLNSQFYSNHAHTQSALGNNATHHVNSTMLSNTHNNHASQFLQHHGNTQHNASLASMGSQQHSSQFLQHHGTQGALAHNGLQNQGLHHQGRQSFANHQNVGNSAFLAHHHQTANSSFNNHHNGINGLGQNNALHHNHVGNYVHNSLTQNFNYRHNGHVGGIGNYGYRHHGWGGYGGYGGYGYRGYGGWGLGYYPGFYGFGFGLGRFGYGWGWGGGYGYGYGGYGYGRWGCFAYQPYCSYQPYGYGYGYGYPGYGYGGYGYGSGYGGYGYNGYGYGSYASLSPGLMGYGYGATYAPYGSSMAIVSSTPVMTDASLAAMPADPVQIASADPKSAVTSALPTPEQYAAIGETAFKARDYKGAVRAWRHGLIDDPNNGVLVLMLSQALFASEQFNESAGATQFGMQQIPQDKWETVVKNYRELYGKIDDYTNQLRALEKVAREKTDDPSLRFLLGYHYGFLGYPKEAVQQLEKCVSLAPEDETAQKLLDYFSEKLPKDPNKKVDPPAPGKPPEPGSTTDNAKLPPLNPTLLPPAPTTPEPIAIPKAGDGN